MWLSAGMDGVMADETRPRLGRGLAALIGDHVNEDMAVAQARGQKRVPIEFLRPNPRNPRRNFAEAELSDLANSIRSKGVIQPILVRHVPHLADVFEIIAGERRWRAAQLASVPDVPVVVLDVGDKEALEIAIIENVQRADLNALEEAEGYQQLGVEFNYTQQELADVIGKSRSHITNMMRLLKLPEQTRTYLAAGEISAGHARALLAVKDSDSVAKRIIADGLTVRDVEHIGQREADTAVSEGAKKPRASKDADTRALEQALSEALGLVVTIAHRGGAGDVRIRYRNLEQLDTLCHKLRG